MFSRFALPTLSLWWGFLFFYGLDSSPLYRTEGLRAMIGVEALHGNWLTPTLYGEPFLTKPPGMYAAIAAASSPDGEVTTESARLPSAVAATVTAFLFFLTFRRYYGDFVGWLAGMLVPISPLWLDKAPSAEIDMLQLMWVAASLLAFLRALEAEETGRHAVGWWVAALVCVAGGFLTKWTAPAFFYLTVGPLLLWRRQLGLLFRPGHLLGVTVAAAICAGWVCAVAAEVGWSPLIETVRAEAVQRLDPNYGGRSYPWGESLTFPVMVLAACVPWCFVGIPTLRPSFLRRCEPVTRRLVQFFHCWAWPNLLFWAAMSEHAVRYAMPMTPAVTGLALVTIAVYFSRLSLKGASANTLEASVSRTRLTAKLAVLIAFWVAVKIAHVEVVCPLRTITRQAPETGAAIARLVPSDEILYLCLLKDEGIMFYYGRPVQKLGGLADLPAGDRRSYLVLLPGEWDDWGRAAGLKPVRWFNDQQGDRFLLAVAE